MENIREVQRILLGEPLILHETLNEAYGTYYLVRFIRYAIKFVIGFYTDMLWQF